MRMWRKEDDYRENVQEMLLGPSAIHYWEAVQVSAVRRDVHIQIQESAKVLFCAVRRIQSQASCSRLPKVRREI
jgi:hypothetical protein